MVQFVRPAPNGCRQWPPVAMHASTIIRVVRAALSIRQINREYGVSRDTVSHAIRNGDLPASQLGTKRILVLRRDFEAWLQKHAVRPPDFAAARVEEVLAREAKAAGS